MSDQQTPPEAPPADPQNDPNEKINPLIETELEAAIIRCGRMGQGDANAQEVKDWAQAAMQFAQALIICNPKLVAPDGIPIDAVHPPRALAKVNPDALTGQVVSGGSSKPAAK